MKHLFVPYEIALMLKEKGFDDEYFGNYYSINTTDATELILVKNESARRKELKEGEKGWWICVAPTYQQVQDWLREKHNIHININPQHSYISELELACGTFPNGKYGGTLDDVTLNKEMMGSDTICLIPTSDSYYEALYKGIEEALKLIK